MKTKPKTRPQKYPWADWFLKKRFTLRQGVEYQGTNYGMANTARNAASRLGYSISLKINEETNTISITVNGRK